MTKKKGHRMRKRKMTDEQLQQWAQRLSFEDKELIRDCIFRLYSASEDIRFDRNKNKIEPYKELTLKGSTKDDGSIEEWQRINKVVKQAEEQFMEAQLAKDVDKIIKDFNEKYNDRPKD